LIENRHIQRLVDIGLTGVYRGRVAESRAVFEGLLAYNPALTAARIGLAFSHLVVDDFETAETMLQSILTTDQDNPEALVMLGLVYKLAGRGDEAAETLTKVPSNGGPSADLARELGQS
jgi:Flp pilus assembly protein TadD